MAEGHDVQEGAQRWAGGFDAAILKILLRRCLLRLDQIVDTVHEHAEVLRLGTQDLLVEDGHGIVEHAAKVRVHEALRNAVPQATGTHRPPLVLEVLDALELTARNHPLWIALLGEQPAPHLWDEEADIVVHAAIWADPAGRRAEPCV